jgi:hypothetical protein
LVLVWILALNLVLILVLPVILGGYLSGDLEQKNHGRQQHHPERQFACVHMFAPTERKYVVDFTDARINPKAKVKFLKVRKYLGAHW